MEIVWKVVLVVSTITVLFSQFPDVTAYPDYEWKSKYHDGNPYFCVIKNSYYSEYGWYIYKGIMDWETKLHATVSTEQQRANWKIPIAFVDQKYDACDVMVYSVTSSSNLCGSRDVTPLGCASYNFAIYLYMDKISSKESFRSTVSHEVGHILGLGHYSAEEERVNQAWITYVHAPSIMVPISHFEPKMSDITDLDIETLKEIYGEGFSKPEPPPPKVDPPPYIPKKETRTSDRIGMVTLSVIYDGNIFGRSTTVQDGEFLQLGGKVMDEYGNGMSGIQVHVNDKTAYSDGEGNFVIDLVMKHNQRNMGINKSTWKFVAEIPVPYGMVESEPVYVYVEKSGLLNEGDAVTEYRPVITLIPSTNDREFGGVGFSVTEDTIIHLTGQVLSKIGKPFPFISVNILDENSNLILSGTKTDNLGIFDLEWKAVHNNNQQNGKSSWNIIAFTNALNEKIQSEPIYITVIDSEFTKKNKEEIDALKELRTNTVNLLKDLEIKTFEQESQLKDANHEKKEARDKIAEALNILSINKEKITYVNNRILQGDSLLEEGNLSDAKLYFSYDPTLDEIKSNVEKISQLINDAKELDKKICFLIWCS